MLVVSSGTSLLGDVIGKVTPSVYDAATAGTCLSCRRAHFRTPRQPGQLRVQPPAGALVSDHPARTSSLTLDLVCTDPDGYSGLETVWAGIRQDCNRIVIASQNGLQNSVNQWGRNSPGGTSMFSPPRPRGPGRRRALSSTGTWCYGLTSRSSLPTTESVAMTQSDDSMHT